MAITRNVGRGEGIVRVILGVILIILGFFLTGFLKPISIIVGGIVILTAIVGH